MKIKAIGLIEMLLVLALCAVILLVSVHYYSEVKNSQRITAMVQQVKDIINASNQCIMGGGTGGTTVPTGKQAVYAVNNSCANIPQLISTGYLAPSYQNNPWGSPNSLQVYYNNTAYQFKACGLSKSSCYAVGAQLAGVMPNSSYQYNQQGCGSQQDAATCVFIISLPGQVYNNS